MEFGYAVPLESLRGVARPLAGVTLLANGADYRLGGELRTQDSFTVSVFGLIHEQAIAPAVLGLTITGSLQW